MTCTTTAMEKFKRERCYEHQKVKAIVKRATSDCAKSDIDYLIRHNFGNHTMQYMVDFEPNPIIDVVYSHFVEYSKHSCANYVVQKCMRNCYVKHLEGFFDLFVASKDEISATFAGQKVKGALDFSLRAKGRTDLASRLQDGYATKWRGPEWLNR